MATGLVEWAGRAPDRAAVMDADRTMTIGELDAAAAALAARLLDGSGPRAAGESWLPIVVDRSVSSMVAVHGAVRAGCAFARIESTTPREVAAEMFGRLGRPRRAIVADPAHGALLPDGVEAIGVYGHGRVGAAAPQAVEHDAPGRVHFTSGSTGRPKGVISRWSGFEAYLRAAAVSGPPDGGEDWTAAFVHPFGAGAILRAILLPSLGHTICIADPTKLSIDELLDWLDARGVEVLTMPSSMARVMVRSADGGRRVPSVSLIRLTSEPAHWSLVEPLRRLGGARLTIRAGYACSEVGGIAHLDIGPDDEIGMGRIPLGYLESGVDVQLEPVDGDPSTTRLVVARPRSLGYLGDPDLTASRYFTDDEGMRWWTSDDIVRADDDGMYHFVGRANEMVKVRGSFVAPSRVEQVLQDIDGIGAAAVLLHVTDTEALRVVAHVQVVDDALTPERVDTELRERLPVELVPAIIVRHDELPSTPRMKLDRAALARAPLVRWRSSPVRPFDSEFEWWCLTEVRRIVGLDDFGPDDDLFQAGLDSLGALELGAALADAGFGGFDPPRLLEAQTVAGIQRMLGATRDPERSAVVVLNDRGTRPPLFALPGGAGNALEWRYLAAALGSDQPVAVVELRGMHSRERPDRTMDARAAHVCGEVEARLGPDDPLVIVGFSGGGPAAYETAQRMQAQGRSVHVVLLDSAPTTKDRQRTPGWNEEYRQYRLHRADSLPSIRTASLREIPGAVARSIRYRRRHHRLARLIRDPGPPNHDRVRYLAFQRIQQAFNNSYDPAPAAFPVTLVTVEGSDAVRRCGGLIQNLVVHEIGGNHRTMLGPPHVDAVAAIVGDVVEAAFAPARQARGE
jgi:acyl-CoA synthetase (AMP-forming)/AMP-acid ligase II/thioesterase domain-containing protein